MAFNNTINPVASVKRKKPPLKGKSTGKMLDDKKCLAKTMSPLIATKMRINSYMLGIMYDCYTRGVSIFGKKQHLAPPCIKTLQLNTMKQNLYKKILKKYYIY